VFLQLFKGVSPLSASFYRLDLSFHTVLELLPCWTAPKWLTFPMMAALKTQDEQGLMWTNSVTAACRQITCLKPLWHNGYHTYHTLWIVPTMYLCVCNILRAKGDSFPCTVHAGWCGTISVSYS